jgi:hypothetical protein
VTHADWKERDTKRARELRNAATPAERELWKYLSRSQLGVKFSRQMQVGPFSAVRIALSSNSTGIRTMCNRSETKREMPTFEKKVLKCCTFQMPKFSAMLKA